VSSTSIYNGQDGFGVNGSAWGIGIYFTSRAAYSDSYAYSAGTEMQMFYAQVLVGHTKNMPQKSYKMPPLKEKQPGNFVDEHYDSIEAQASTEDVNYVIYDVGRAYPAYLLIYKRET